MPNRAAHVEVLDPLPLDDIRRVQAALFDGRHRSAADRNHAGCMADGASATPAAEASPAVGDPHPGRMPAAHWDTLHDAVVARLRLIAAAADAGHGADRIGTALLECTQALEQLHGEVTRERGRRLHVEGESRRTVAALASARQKLNRARAGERHARHLALHDGLTLLPNRRGFGERLDEALSLPRAAPAVLYIDLDGFKSVNDCHGHGTGDELLRIVAVRLAHSVRMEDTVCRMGGDEFACMLVDPMGREQLGHVACKLFDAVSAPIRIGALQLTVRPSIGIARSPTDGADSEVLLRCADAAMYHAKRERIGYAFFGGGGHA